MKRTYAALLLAATFAWAQRPDIPAQLTLAQALNIALTNSTTLREAQARLDEASGRRTQAQSTLLPQLSLTARQAFQTVNLVGFGTPVTTEPGVIGPFGSMAARLLFSQDLVNISNIRASRSARWLQASSRFLVDNARELVVVNVVTAYLYALRAKATRDTLADRAVRNQCLTVPETVMCVE